MTLPGHIDQPGPVGAPVSTALTGLVPLAFDLPAGQTLDQALSSGLAAHGVSSGYVDLADLALSTLSYVIPARAPDARHVAWYSAPHQTAPARITRAGITCGTHQGAPFFHCHGLFETGDGAARMGHLLPESCVLATTGRAVGYGYAHARFARVPDPETGFDLFMPEQLSPPPTDQAMLVRIAPNVEIGAGLAMALQRTGWARARVHGIGSIIGAHFDDGRVMDSFATELLVLSGPDPLEIALVGLDGQHMQGRLAKGKNPVLITAEILVRNIS